MCICCSAIHGTSSSFTLKISTIHLDDFLAGLHEKIGGPSNRLDRDFSDRVEFVKLDWVLPEGISHSKEELDPVSRFSKLMARYLPHIVFLSLYHSFTSPSPLS